MTQPRAIPPATAAGEQRIVINGVSWERYVQVRDAIESPGVRMTYDRGALEMMSPSKRHETIKAAFARLVSFYAFEKGIDLNDHGSTTFRSRVKERGLEPDTCWRMGSVAVDEEIARPDIALEVVVSKSAIDKLAVYRALEVPEVWAWEEGRVTVQRLGTDGYQVAPRSAFLPDLDLALVTKLAEIPSQLEALRQLREHLERI